MPHQAHLILTPLSFSPSFRRPVPLQEGPRGVQRVLPVRPGRRRAAERRRRWRRWGCDARASPGSGRVGRRGRINPHHAGGPGGGAAEVMCHRPPAGHLRSRALAMQDFQTSAAKHRPSSPMLEGILTLKSFMIPYPKLCDLPSDIAGGWVMISWALSWSLSCLIS